MEKLPSILLVTIDCLRSDHLGCGGYNKNTSPFIDQLSRNGFFFPEGICNGACTAASIYSLLTSRYPHEDGGFDIVRAKTVIESLREKGYLTAAFIDSNPFLSARVGYARGFDCFFNPVYSFLPLRKNRGCEKVRLFTEEVEVWLARERLGPLSGVSRYLLSLYRAQKDNEPLSPYLGGKKLNKIVLKWIEKQRGKFFVWIHYMDVHSPYRTSREYFEKVNKKECSRFSMEEVNIKLKSGNLMNMNEYDIQLIKDIYDAEIRYVDECVREVYEFIKEKTDNFIFVLTADHGEEFFEHGKHHNKLQLYDEMLKVPIIIQAPGIKENKFGAQVELIDVAPTILDLVGFPPEISFMGKSLLSPMQKRRMIFTEANHYQIIKHPKKTFLKLSWRKTSIRFSEGNKKWKYIYDAKTSIEELYDLMNDPNERDNLSTAPSKRKMLVKARKMLFYHLRRQRGKLSRKKRLQRKIEALKEANFHIRPE